MTILSRLSFTQIARTAGIIGMVAIAVLSLVPGPVRPHVLPTGGSEHFVAYGLTALTLLAGYGRGVRGLTIATIVTVYAGLLETLQAVIPGRESRLEDFGASAIGVWGAFMLLLLIKLTQKYLLRRCSP
jgi:VanZ family protein